MLTFTSEHGTNLNFFNAGGINCSGADFINFAICLNQTFLRVLWINDVIAGESTDQAFAQLHDFVFAFKPRTPANLRTCWRLPRAPESTISETGLYSCLPWF